MRKSRNIHPWLGLKPLSNLSLNLWPLSDPHQWWHHGSTGHPLLSLFRTPWHIGLSTSAQGIWYSALIWTLAEAARLEVSCWVALSRCSNRVEDRTSYESQKRDEASGGAHPEAVLPQVATLCVRDDSLPIFGWIFGGSNLVNKLYHFFWHKYIWIFVRIIFLYEYIRIFVCIIFVYEYIRIFIRIIFYTNILGYSFV